MLFCLKKFTILFIINDVTIYVCFKLIVLISVLVLYVYLKWSGGKYMYSVMFVNLFYFIYQYFTLFLKEMSIKLN